MTATSTSPKTTVHGADMHSDLGFSAGITFMAIGAIAELLSLPAGWLVLAFGAVLMVLS